MSQQATVRGTVVYRLGDGPACEVPKGPVEVDRSPQDVTLSWQVEDVRQSAAIPRADFARFVETGDIVLR